MTKIAATTSTPAATSTPEVTSTPAPAPKKESGLSTGATVGIIILCLAIIVISALLKDYLWSLFGRIFGLSKSTTDYLSVRNA